MKKLIVLIAIGTIGFLSTQEEAKAWKRGSWVDTYEGGTSPAGATCVSTWSRSCLTGDRKTYPV